MVNYFIYAKELSVFTDQNRHYNSNGLKTLEQFKSDVNKIEKRLQTNQKTLIKCDTQIIYLHWGNECCEVSEGTITTAYKKQLGANWWREPETIKKWIKKNVNMKNKRNKIRLMYIITQDWLIWDPKPSFQVNNDVRYESVVLHIFNECPLNTDTSVAACFFKCWLCEMCLVYHNFEIIDDIDTSKEFVYRKINVDNFESEKDSLKTYIKFKFINSYLPSDQALQEIDKLKKLRDRLFKELASKRNSAVNLNKVSINKTISTIIKYIVNDKKAYSFDVFNLGMNDEAEEESTLPDIILNDEKRVPVTKRINYFIYAKDFTISTRGVSHYHNNGLISFEQFKSDVEKIKTSLQSTENPPVESKIIYLHWEADCYEVDEGITKTAYKELASTGVVWYRRPQSIIRWIKNKIDINDENKKIKLLYIITHGLIDQPSKTLCFKLNKNVHYESVVFHAFNENLQEIDLSVAASFFKSRCKLYRDFDLFDDIDIAEEFDYGKIQAENFAVEINNLKSYIRLKFIKVSKHDAHALQEIDKLKELRHRLLDEVTNKQKGEGLETIIIKKIISNLINYIDKDNNSSYLFDALKIDVNMVNYYIYATDLSQSTYRVGYYHSNGLKSLQQFKSDVEEIETSLQSTENPPVESKIIYLHWGDKCYEFDERNTEKAYKEQAGIYMGTEPQTIIQWIKNNIENEEKIKLLYIITDGLIEQRCANSCFELNKDRNYESVVFHAFNENPDHIDLSVAASFFKSRCKVYRNYDLCDDIDIAEEFDYDKINVDNFGAETDNLKSYIRLKFIKSSKHDAHALQEIDKLKKLRDRLFNELVSKKKDECNLETKDRNVFLREFVRTDWYESLFFSAHEQKVVIEKIISTLINYIVNDKKSYSFDALKFDIQFSNPVEEEPIVDVNFPAEEEIPFPDIILDDDKGIPVIILAEFNLLDKLIFHKTEPLVKTASFNKFKSAMECPLFLANDPDVSQSIGYFYTLNVYKQLLAQGPRTEPRTRRPFRGGLVLTNTGHFDNYNDYILSATYFDQRKINFNVGLFYFVLWKNCENKEWMDRNVVEQFKKYAMRRISETVCKIGLSSLPLDPPMKTSLPTALWYCVELSSCIFKDDPQNFMQERLRMYCGLARHMIEILRYFDYDLNLEVIDKRRKLIGNVMTLKRIQTRGEKLYYMLERIFKTVDGFLVSEIEKPSNLYILNCLKINHEDLLRDEVLEEKVHLNDYVHMMHVLDLSDQRGGIEKIEISEKTFRPYFALSQNKSFYTELVKATKKAVINNDGDKDKIAITFEPVDSLEFDKVLSHFKLFIDCVQDSGTYPTLPEYKAYISKKKKFNGDLVTIFPYNILDVEKVYARYQSIVTKVDVKEFIKVTKSYVNRYDRIKVEEMVKFNNDTEIKKFVSSEESKVHLIKNELRKNKK